MVENTAYLGLGSNEGDRAGAIGRALARLGETPGVRVMRVSSLRETELEGDGPVQGPFRNGIAEVRTTLAPAALLGVMLALEAEAGRRRPAPPNHPRPLDLDLLAFGAEVIDRWDLIVPHPRWQDRAFVTEPLAELGVDTTAWHRWQRPRLVHDEREFAAQCASWRAGGCRLGLVPTMGALHDGHVSLVERARAQCDRVAVTIFVNPLQFAAGEDLDRYPRTLARDVERCRAAGADAVFVPAAAGMYPDGFCSRLAVGREAQGMEGALRPDHFAGVATVVAKLFATSWPDRAFFGQKDAQQLAVIRRMTLDLGFPVEIVPCPIVREPDGLAMSSRNAYLDAEDRAAAPVLFRALLRAREAFAAGERDRDALLAQARALLDAEARCTTDYVELRRAERLEPLAPGRVDGGRLLVAARFGAAERTVRLIDNLSLVDEVEA